MELKHWNGTNSAAIRMNRPESSRSSGVTPSMISGIAWRLTAARISVTGVTTDTISVYNCLTPVMILSGRFAP